MCPSTASIALQSLATGTLEMISGVSLSSISAALVPVRSMPLLVRKLPRQTQSSRPVLGTGERGVMTAAALSGVVGGVEGAADFGARWLVRSGRKAAISRVVVSFEGPGVSAEVEVGRGPEV